MAITGDFSKLSQLAAKLCAASAAIPRVAASAVPGVKSAIDEQFARGSDPYGVQWAPLASGEASHLTETGEMKDSLAVSANGSSIVATMGGPSGYHQSGTDKMPQRQIFPEEGGAMPPALATVITEAVELEVSKILQGA